MSSPAPLCPIDWQQCYCCLLQLQAINVVAVASYNKKKALNPHWL
jgi:hypothetical protein